MPTLILLVLAVFAMLAALWYWSESALPVNGEDAQEPSAPASQPADAPEATPAPTPSPEPTPLPEVMLTDEAAATLDAFLDAQPSTVSVWLQDLTTGDTYTYNESSGFYCASTLKAPYALWLAQRDEAEYLLWRVIQQEGSSPAGLALWMGWKLQMQPGEIASLTWGQVDFDQNLIRLPDRTVSMGSRLRRLLLDAWDRRKDPTEPRVFTAPTTGRPMDLSRLTTVTRTALIRGGLEHVNLRNLHTWVRQGDRAQLLMAQAEEQGWLTREAVMERLGVSKSTARQYLLELREAGRLVRVGTRYYPAGAVADPDDHLDIIRAYLQEHGTGRRQDFIRLLGLEPEQGTLLLRRLTDRGERVLTGRHYTLPEQEK